MRLPRDADLSKIEAKYENGVLQLKIPKVMRTQQAMCAECERTGFGHPRMSARVRCCAILKHSMRDADSEGVGITVQKKGDSGRQITVS